MKECNMRFPVMKLIVCFIVLISIVGSISAQDFSPHELITYKKTPQGELKLHMFYPEEGKEGVNRPAMVCFFGGGWVGGNPKQFYQHCSYFASRGMVAISAEYRVKRFHKTSPFECVKDGKSAIRWVRQHAKELGIDPNRIVSCGGSAGGHVAACTGVIDEFEEDTEEVNISSKPNAMVLFNPVLDTTEKGYGSEKLKGAETIISPNHHVTKDIVPSIVFHGTSDKTVPFDNALEFERLMKEKGNDCLLIPAFGEDHGFFNGTFIRKNNTDAYLNYTLYCAETFLWKQGILKKAPENWQFDFKNTTFRTSKLDSKKYHSLRKGLKNSQIKFVKEKKGTVAFLGGSITFNKGWRDMVCAYLKEKFPETEFTFIAAGIPSEGTTSGAYRLMRDVLSKGEVDLLFEEAAVNDRSPALRRNSTDRVRGMEGIVRHALKANPTMDIVMMHFVDPSKMENYNNGTVPTEIADHNKVAVHYNIPVINLAKEVTERINAGEFTWEGDFKNLHPSPFGQDVYFQSMKKFLETAYFGFVADDDKVVAHALPVKLDRYCYDNGGYIEIEKAKYGKGWKIDPAWKPRNKERVRRGNTDIPLLVCEESGPTLKLEFTGSAIGIIGLSGPDAGTLEYTIDGKQYPVFDQYTVNSYFQHLPRYFVLAAELDPNKKHVLKLKLAEHANEQSKGNACRIKSFIVNK
ncbi:hypothetical protein EYV94_15870 [Puteibacter caeruleilacunae]|nr:hypothetical protein EYV94_15870 [Puteibacter caeruleilacunae]